jgi:hypothetical protein
MSLLELWNLTPADADAFAERYWAAKDARVPGIPDLVLEPAALPVEPRW